MKQNYFRVATQFITIYKLTTVLCSEELGVWLDLFPSFQDITLNVATMVRYNR